MDLVTFFKEYQGIITLASGLVLAILGYQFGKWNSERQRKWEVRDRQLKEAYACVNLYRNIVEVIDNYERAMLSGIDYIGSIKKEITLDELMEGMGRRVGEYPTFYSQVPKLLWDVLEMNTSMVVLGDRKLSRLYEELHRLIFDEVEAIGKFGARIEQLDESNSSQIKKLLDDVRTELDRVREYSTKAHFLIRDMKLRLDKLAQTVK